MKYRLINTDDNNRVRMEKRDRIFLRKEKDERSEPNCIHTVKRKRSNGQMNSIFSLC